MGCNLPLWYMQAETQNTFMFRRKLIQIFKNFFYSLKMPLRKIFQKGKEKQTFYNNSLIMSKAIHIFIHIEGTMI